MTTDYQYCKCNDLTPGYLGSHAVKRNWLERLLLKIRHLDIVNVVEGPNGTKRLVLYMRRYFLFRSKWFGLNLGDIYLHQIVRSDSDPAPHDHPFNFVSFLLRGRYEEVRYSTIPGTRWSAPCISLRPTVRTFKAGSILHRKRSDVHQIGMFPRETAWTLVFTSRSTGNWNFWTEEGPVPWKKYLEGKP